jgi:hypothetical protein
LELLFLLGIALFGMGSDKKLLFLEDIKLPFIILGLPLSLWQFLNFQKLKTPQN